MELAVWEVPHEFENRKELPAVIDACERLWRDHILSKMAVPEVSLSYRDVTGAADTRLIDLCIRQVLENQTTSLCTFADIEEKILAFKFPGRNVFTSPSVSPNNRIFVALTWAKTRARRDKSKPEWLRSSAEEKSTDEWVAFNTRRSNVLFPTNSILCGVWYAEWNISGTFDICNCCHYVSGSTRSSPTPQSAHCSWARFAHSTSGTSRIAALFHLGKWFTAFCWTLSGTMLNFRMIHGHHRSTSGQVSKRAHTVRRSF